MIIKAKDIIKEIKQPSIHQTIAWVAKVKKIIVRLYKEKKTAITCLVCSNTDVW